MPRLEEDLVQTLFQKRPEQLHPLLQLLLCAALPPGIVLVKHRLHHHAFGGGALLPGMAIAAALGVVAGLCFIWWQRRRQRNPAYQIRAITIARHLLEDGQARTPEEAINRTEEILAAEGVDATRRFEHYLSWTLLCIAILAAIAFLAWAAMGGLDDR